ncbi:putative Exosome complex component CSL4 [Blattamonas nauphoetae]|uniref:Exosome complex component CSL4 n=1 Tax=Blattamonas nauphoetae TaxID=2049346 RepID=A0ABQ9XPX3_9EUKA|nr:putative Exosome complex component CSL4 [Blattamonas nauphoetae]
MYFLSIVTFITVHNFLFMSSVCVVPGQHVGEISIYEAGAGTRLQGQSIFATRFGEIQTSNSILNPGKLKIEVINRKLFTQIPQIGSIVYCRAEKLFPGFARTVILTTDETFLPQPFPGMIRKQDIRPLNTDELEIQDCFRPGDIIRSRVISLGDSHSFYLSTAGVDLGVVYATSLDGAPLEAIAWNEMRCSATGKLEKRKVAKPSSS